MVRNGYSPGEFIHLGKDPYGGHNRDAQGENSIKILEISFSTFLEFLKAYLCKLTQVHLIKCKEDPRSY